MSPRNDHPEQFVSFRIVTLMQRVSLVCVLLCGFCCYGQQPPNPAAHAPDDACDTTGCVMLGDPAKAPLRDATPVVIRSPDRSSERGRTAGFTDPSHDSPVHEAVRLSTVPPPAPLTDFEQLVEDTLGHRLMIFGRTLFETTPAEFASSSALSAPADYLVGPGDEIVIRAWGKIDIDVHPIVDRNGQIFLPRIGTLTVAGMRSDQLGGFIRSSIEREFKGFDLTVTLGQLRSIQIFMLGQARHPGVLTISSLTTLVGALFSSGGPSSSGTMRDIQLQRGGRTIAHLDLYRMLLQGDKTADVHLLPGDSIFIPFIGPQVAVDGDVTAPGIYELTADTTVDAIVSEAGGLTPVASVARVVLDRLDNHASRSVLELPFDATGRMTPVKGGDILRVLPLSSRIENAVTLRGTVGSPGRYAWHPGMRVSDLIPSRRFLLTREYYNDQNGLDVPIANNPFAVLKSEDKGATSTTPALANHDTEMNWNYAVIERLNPNDLTTQIVPFALGQAIDQPSSPENKLLAPGDVVVVYARKDINLPVELEAKFVLIDGQVQAPGVYRIEDNETLRHLVLRAGGLAPHAYLYASQLNRDSLRVAQEATLREMLEQESREALSPVNLAEERSSSGGSPDPNSTLALRRAYLAELGKIHPTGRVVLQLQATENDASGLPEFTLQDGDHFFVPQRPNTISVLGSVYNQGALRFVEGFHVSKYLDAAGGSTREGDRKRTFILRADGTIVSRQHAGNFEKLSIYPGDTVVVPPRMKPGFNAYRLLDLSQALSSIALTAAVVKSFDN